MIVFYDKRKTCLSFVIGFPIQHIKLETEGKGVPGWHSQLSVGLLISSLLVLVSAALGSALSTVSLSLSLCSSPSSCAHSLK